MAHEIDRNEDYVYATQDGLPWHGLGVQQSKRMKLAEVIEKLPRMAETPILQRIYYRDPSVTETREARDCGNKRAIVYPSDGTFLGIATENYQPKAFSEAFEEAFGWVENLGAWVSGAALLRGGTRAFIMARCPDLDFTVGDGDKHTMWLSVFAGSDGKTGIYPHATAVREVCANTVAAGMADAKERGSLFRISHHGNVEAKLAEASVALGQLAGIREAYSKACEAMLQKTVGDYEAKEFVRTLIPNDSTRSENAREAILRLARSGKGNPRYAGTAYALFQGVTDYVDHEAVKTSQGDLNEKRFLYGVEGSGASLKESALKLLLQGTPVAIAA